MPSKKRLFFSLIISLSIFFPLSVQRVWGAENPPSEHDINRLKKEIGQVKTERQRLREDIARDNAEFALYQERTAVRKKSYISETDSVRRVIATFGRKTDSLDAYIIDIELKKKNYDLLKTRFREHIAKACDKLLGAVKKYPPAVSRPAVGALTFLLNDCAAKNIDNIEALQRFIQIVRNLDEATLSVQTGQEASPAPSIRGTATMLRIGSVFEAFVDEDGKNAAVWHGSETGESGWLAISNTETVGAISKAIAIRESKSLPAFIFLPWGPDISKETGK
jgi:hypothetical protein